MSIIFFLFFYCAVRSSSGLEMGPREGILGYDCGANDARIATISLVETPPCLKPNASEPTIRVKIAVTQTRSIGEVDTYRCFAYADHIVTRCGKSIDQQFNRGFYMELVPIDLVECKNLISTGKILFMGQWHSGPIGSGIINSDFMSIGYANNDGGNCNPGVPFSRDGVRYDRPLQNTKFIVKYSKEKARVDYEDNKIIFPNGMRCNYDGLSCNLGDSGYAYWDVIKPTCIGQKDKSLVYIGHALRSTVPDDNDSFYYQVSEGTQEFQLKAMRSDGIDVCGFPSFRTEHPRLFVTELADGPVFPIKKIVGNLDVNLMDYINSKFMYSHRHVAGEVQKLFEIFMLDRCNSQNRITENLQTLAQLSPIDFAFQFMKGPGYTAAVYGEVVYVARCNPVPVIPATSEEGCYNEMPVSYRNRTYFLHPRSRILTTIGRKIACIPGMPPMYLFNNEWVVLTRDGLMRTERPQVITPSDIHFKFRILSSLSSGGLYTEEAMEKMQKAVLLPMEEKIMASRLSTAISDKGALPPGYRLTNALTLDDFNKINQKMESWVHKGIGFFKTFGTWTASFLGFVLFFKAIVYLLT